MPLLYQKIQAVGSFACTLCGVALDALKYVREHPDLTQEECCKNLGIGLSTLSRWQTQFRDNDGDIPTRGSGNYASDEQKEIARLKRELRDAQDALDVLKKAISILGKN